MQKVYKKLAIIDASYCLHRNLHMDELMNLKNSKGKHSGGIFGFLRSLNKIIENIPVGYYPVCCWDSRVAQRRLDAYPNYKHQQDNDKDALLKELALKRLEDPEVSLDEVADADIIKISEKMKEILSNRRIFGQDSDPEDYLSQYVNQRNDLIEVLNYFGIPNLKVKNWEGDDLMTLMSRITEDSIIVTDDSDLRQLISPNVSVLRVLKEVKMLKYDTYPNAIKIALVKAITGDGSDNVPQLIKGLGAKGAEEFVKVIQDCNEDPTRFSVELPNRVLTGRNVKFVRPFLEKLKEYDRNLELVDLRRVPDDMEVYNYMIAQIDSTLNQANYFKMLGLLSEYEIQKVNFDKIFTTLSKLKMEGIKV